MCLGQNTYFNYFSLHKVVKQKKRTKNEIRNQDACKNYAKNILKLF